MTTNACPNRSTWGQGEAVFVYLVSRWMINPLEMFTMKSLLTIPKQWSTPEENQIWFFFHQSLIYQYQVVEPHKYIDHHKHEMQLPWTIFWFHREKYILRINWEYRRALLEFSEREFVPLIYQKVKYRYSIKSPCGSLAKPMTLMQTIREAMYTW